MTVFTSWAMNTDQDLLSSVCSHRPPHPSFFLSSTVCPSVRALKPSVATEQRHCGGNCPVPPSSYWTTSIFFFTFTLSSILAVVAAAPDAAARYPPLVVGLYPAAAGRPLMTAFVKATALRLFLSLCCKQADSSSQIGNVLFHLTSSKEREKGGEVEA